MLRARAVGIFGGVTFFFCSSTCKSLYNDPRATRRPEADSGPVPVAVVTKPATLSGPIVLARATSTARISSPHLISSPEAVPEIPEVASAAGMEPGTEDLLTARRPVWALPLVVVLLGSAAYWTISALRAGDEHPAAATTVAATQPPPATPTAPVVPVAVAPSPPAVVPAPATVAAPPAPVPAAPSVKVAPTAPTKVTATPDSPSQLTPPLKLGLRRFVDAKNDHTDVSLRLLVVDAADDAHGFELERLEVSPEDPAATLPATAIAPHDEFLAPGTRTGRIFDDTLESGDERVEVRVSRSEDAIVAEVKRSPRAQAQAAHSSWRVVLRLPVEASAQVRAAPFARKRYTSAPAPAQ